ncbi:MAG TPA: acyl-CoA thioesterase [Bacteroidales bacterium]|nr:acyl-CoA thioesterase [Bacteroidales bacterium]
MTDPRQNAKRFELEFLVRDYECDLQGVVNNANYQHYLEHARHEFLISKEISFDELHREGIDLVVTKAVLEYKFPLKSRDRFVIQTDIEREGNAKLVFNQDIFRLPDMKPVVKAKVTGVATRNGRPIAPGDLVIRLGLA